MKSIAIFSFLLALAASPAWANDDLPPRKPGLWSLTVEGGAKPMTMQACVDAESEKKTLAKARATMAGLCSKLESHLSGNTYTQDSVCEIGGAKQTSHSVTTIVDDANMVTIVSSSYDPPKRGRNETKQTMKWLGPCGADLKPGQMKMNGRMIDAQ